MKAQQKIMLVIILCWLASCQKDAVQSKVPTIAATSGQRIQTASIEQPFVMSSHFIKGITNKYLGFTPGTVFKYINVIGEGNNITVEHITITVTNDIKTILGVPCTVVHDEVKVKGKIKEDTYDWYAQDKFGNVWYFGENTKSYEDGKVDSSGSFEAGVDGALPGIIMFGNPDKFIGITYYQEFYPHEAVDEATLLSTSGTAAVVYGTFKNCVVTKEFTKLEPGVLEYKYYAPGVGQILTVLNKGGQEREELISVTH